MARVLGLIAALLLVAGGFLVGSGAVPCQTLGQQPACQVLLRPGPSDDAVGFVTIDGETGDVPGELRLTTVAVEDQLSWSSWLGARSSSAQETVPRERIYPPGLDRDEVAETNAALMVDSQQVATIVALEELGFELQGRGAIVAAVTEDAVTDELEPGDVIEGFNGAPIEESADVVAAVRATDPGTPVVFSVRGDNGARRDVEVVLGRSPEDDTRAYVGVLLTTDLDLPVDVAIDAGVIGGPSAGLFFALAIVDLLGDEDLTGGEVIAGTGTLSREGLVGSVGGVRQKVAGASAPTNGDPPASVFLVPRDNLDEARDTEVVNDLLVVPVDTFDDALAALAAVRDGQEPTDAVLLAASAD